jgi:hypothetical protein
MYGFFACSPRRTLSAEPGQFARSFQKGSSGTGTGTDTGEGCSVPSYGSYTFASMEGILMCLRRHQRSAFHARRAAAELDGQRSQPPCQRRGLAPGAGCQWRRQRLAAGRARPRQRQQRGRRRGHCRAHGHPERLRRQIPGPGQCGTWPSPPLGTCTRWQCLMENLRDCFISAMEPCATPPPSPSTSPSWPRLHFFQLTCCSSQWRGPKPPLPPR